MVKNALLYIIGIFVLGAIASFTMSLILGALPFLVITFICGLPFYGAFRRYKQWNSEALGLKAWFKWFCKIFKFGKPSLTFYLILGLAVYFVHDEIAMMLLSAMTYAIGGGAIVFIVWESVRVVILKIKQVEIPSFMQAVKGVW